MKYLQSKKRVDVQEVPATDAKRVYIDFETYSDISLKDFGAWAYAEHDSTEVLFMSYAFDDGPVKTWHQGSLFPADVLNAVENGAVVVAFNFGFEDAIWQRTLKLPAIPADQIIDPMTVALSLAYPAQLEQLAPFLGLPEEQQKLKKGKELIRLFCMPQKKGAPRATSESHPTDWFDFVRYGAQDIVSMRRCLAKMSTINMIPSFWVEVRHDVEMNRRGVSVDLELAGHMLEVVDARGRDVNKLLAEITDGRVTTVNQTARINKELSRLKLPNMQKETVEEALKMPLEIHERRLLELRQEAGLAATKKYAAFVNRTSKDGRLRGFMRLYGARRTGRYNSQGVQLQNLVRPTMKWPEISDWIKQILTAIEAIPTESIMEVASNVLRPTLIAADGRIFVISDLSQIEARVLPWLAGDQTTLDVFSSGRDIYKDAAVRIYAIFYDAVTEDQRFVGKTATLALGYGQWVTGFVKFCAKYGFEISEEDAYDIVVPWRNTHKEIVTYWKTIENAFKHVIRNGGKAAVREKVLIYRNQKDIVIKLPSGRHLCYPKAFLRDGEILFQGELHLESTYGGKLVENITQAVARDVMVGNLPTIQDEGYDVLFTVHDEVITEIDEDVSEGAAEKLDSLLAAQPSWAEGLPLKAEGYISKRYRKEK